MMLFLKKNISISLNSSPSLLHLSSSLSSAPHKSQFVANYLIESCGFSPEKAATASKHINFTSPSKPDSVRHFLKHHAGFTDANIRSIVSRNFLILCADVDKTIEPNFRALYRITSWSSTDILQLAVTNPSILVNPHAISRLEYWKNFLNDDMKKLLLASKRNLGLFCMDIDKSVAQKIALLNEYGFSQSDVGTVLVKGRGFFCRTTTSVEVLLKRVEELGLPRGSLMFLRCLLLLSFIGHDTFKGKMEAFKRYGWSEKEFRTALQKTPDIVCLSKENVRKTMEFLVGRTGCTPSYIASHSLLLMFSLEKRLMPRHHVISILESADLLGNRVSLPTFMRFSETKFIEKFIHQNIEKLPDLHDIYTAACAGRLHLKPP